MKITLRILSREAYALLNIVNLYIKEGDHFDSNFAQRIRHEKEHADDDRICLEIENIVGNDFDIAQIFTSITKELIIWRPGEKISLKSDIPNNVWFDFEPHKFKIRTNKDLWEQYKQHREIPENETIFHCQDN